MAQTNNKNRRIKMRMTKKSLCTKIFHITYKTFGFENNFAYSQIFI